MTISRLSRLLITMIMMLTGVPTGSRRQRRPQAGRHTGCGTRHGQYQRHRSRDWGKDRHHPGWPAAFEHKTVGVAFAPDGDVIVVHRTSGLIRVNPVTGVRASCPKAGIFSDPWAIAIDHITGYIYVADSGYDNDRPEINEAGKIIRVDPVSGAQELIASGNPCNSSRPSVACQNTTSAGSYLAHPYGIAIDYTTGPATLVVADMSSFNGKGAIIRIQPVAERRADAVVGAGDRVASPTGRAIVSTGMSDGCRRRAQRQHPDDHLHVPGPVDSDRSSASRDVLRMRCAGDLSTRSDEQRSERSSTPTPRRGSQVTRMPLAASFDDHATGTTFIGS